MGLDRRRSQDRGGTELELKQCDCIDTTLLPENQIRLQQEAEEGEDDMVIFRRPEDADSKRNGPGRSANPQEGPRPGNQLTWDWS